MRIATFAVIAATALMQTLTVRPIDAQQQAPMRVPRSVLERYVGDYVHPAGVADVKVRLKGDTLVQELPGQLLAYMPMSETLFRMGGVFTAEFVIDKAGGVTQILSDGVGIEYRLRRRGSPPAPPAGSATASVVAARVPRSVLQQYVGEYEYVPGQMDRSDLRVFVRLKGDNLYREGAGPTARLIPISETQFKVENSSFDVEFVVDEWGVMQVMGKGFQQMLVRSRGKR